MREDSWEQETRKSYHQPRVWVCSVWRNLEGFVESPSIGFVLQFRSKYNFQLFSSETQYLVKSGAGEEV